MWDDAGLPLDPLSPVRQRCLTEMSSFWARHWRYYVAIKVLQTESDTAVKERYPAWFLGGHTKMDTILTYWQQLTHQIRWEELLWRSHLSRGRWIWIQAITKLTHHSVTTQFGDVPAYCLGDKVCVCINSVLHGWITRWTHEYIVWISHYSERRLWKLAQQRRRYARTPKSNKGYYIHRLVATMKQGWKTAKQACFSSPH